MYLNLGKKDILFFIDKAKIRRLVEVGGWREGRRGPEVWEDGERKEERKTKSGKDKMEEGADQSERGRRMLFLADAVPGNCAFRFREELLLPTL